MFRNRTAVATKGVPIPIAKGLELKPLHRSSLVVLPAQLACGLDSARTNLLLWAESASPVLDSRCGAGAGALPLVGIKSQPGETSDHDPYSIPLCSSGPCPAECAVCISRALWKSSLLYQQSTLLKQSCCMAGCSIVLPRT